MLRQWPSQPSGTSVHTFTLLPSKPTSPVFLSLLISLGRFLEDYGQGDHSLCRVLQVDGSDGCSYLQTQS